MTAKKNRRKRLNNKGFTFIELLVAVAILGVCVAPIVSTFVVTARMNYKGRHREQAQTVAMNIVEGVKAFGVSKTVSECKESNTSTFVLIPRNTDGTEISHKITSSALMKSVINVAGYEYWVGQTFPADTEITTKSKTYTIQLDNILMGATYFDAIVTITPNYDKEYVAAYVFEATFTDAGMSNLKYYDVTADVKIHGESEVLTSYSGTFVDQD